MSQIKINLSRNNDNHDFFFTELLLEQENTIIEMLSVYCNQAIRINKAQALFMELVTFHAKDVTTNESSDDT